MSDMTQAALAQVREALAAGPTPGEWVCYDDSSDGKTNRIEIAAIGKTVARIYRSVQEQDLPNARLIAACSPANMTAILAHVDAQEAEVKRLRAAVMHEADCVEAAKAEIERLTDENGRLRADLLAGRNVVNAGLTIHTLTLERDELRRQLDPMGEYASADELIAALHAEKAEDEAMKLDARRYRWLRGDSCPDHSSRWTQWEVRCWKAPFWTGDLRRADLDDAIDAAIDAAKDGA